MKSADRVWTRGFVLVILINFLVFMNHIMILSTFPMFLENVLGLDEAVAGAAAFAFSAVAVLLRPVIGWMLDCGKRRSVLFAGLCGMLLTWGALENFLADYALKFGLPSGGVFFAITAVMLLLVRVTIGKLADKRGEGIFVYSCNAAMLAAFLLLALAPGKLTFCAAAVLAGYAFGGIEPALQSMAVHIAPPERRGSANSTFLCAYDIGLGGGGGIAGVLISAAGYRDMFLILSLATVASVLLYVFWGRHHRSSFGHKNG